MSTIVAIMTGSRPVGTPAEFGAAIRARRKALGLRQSDVALQSGVTLATVSAIENGKENARLGLVLQICRDLGLQLEAKV